MLSGIVHKFSLEHDSHCNTLSDSSMPDYRYLGFCPVHALHAIVLVDCGTLLHKNHATRAADGRHALDSNTRCELQPKTTILFAVVLCHSCPVYARFQRPRKRAVGDYALLNEYLAAWSGNLTVRLTGRTNIHISHGSHLNSGSSNSHPSIIRGGAGWTDETMDRRASRIQQHIRVQVKLDYLPLSVAVIYIANSSLAREICKEWRQLVEPRTTHVCAADELSPIPFFRLGAPWRNEKTTPKLHGQLSTSV